VLEVLEDRGDQVDLGRHRPLRAARVGTFVTWLLWPLACIRGNTHTRDGGDGREDSEHREGVLACQAGTRAEPERFSAWSCLCPVTPGSSHWCAT
jgi:hypothetical protein